MSTEIAQGSDTHHATPPAGALMAQEYLTFTLGAEEYGVDILKVQEIRGYDTVTRIPDAPPYIKGVINLRGTIVPVLDLRIKFRFEQVVYNDFTVMIILNVAGRVVGIVVDGVSDVLQLGAEQLRPPPEMAFGPSGSGNAFVTGIGALAERMLILIDIEKLLSASDLGLMNSSEPATASH